MHFSRTERNHSVTTKKKQYTTTTITADSRAPQCFSFSSFFSRSDIRNTNWIPKSKRNVNRTLDSTFQVLWIFSRYRIKFYCLFIYLFGCVFIDRLFKRLNVVSGPFCEANQYTIAFAFRLVNIEWYYTVFFSFVGVLWSSDGRTVGV